MAGIFVSGTDTDIGKTVATAAIVKALRDSGVNAVAYKPIQTGIECDQTDQSFYEQVVGSEGVVPTTYAFNIPCSPHLAAKADKETISIDVIKHRVFELEKLYDLVVVEGAGGLVVPLTDEGGTLAILIKELAFPMIVVTKSKVGMLNHTALTVHYATYHGIHVSGLILNEFRGSGDDVEQDNFEMVQRMTRVPVVAKIPLFSSDVVKEVRSYAKHILIKNIWNGCES